MAKICKHKDEKGECICAEVWRAENKAKLKAYHKAWAAEHRPAKNPRKEGHTLNPYYEKNREKILQKRKDSYMLYKTRLNKEVISE